MLVKFTDIYLAQSESMLTSSKCVRKSDAVSIATAAGIDFEAIFLTTENMEKRMLHWLAQDALKGDHILFAKPFETMPNALPGNDKQNDVFYVSDLVKISPQFLYYYLYLKKNQVIVSSKSGQHLSKEKLIKLTIPVPALTIQKNIIASFKKQVDNESPSLKNILQQIENLKKENNLAVEKVFKTINRFYADGKLANSDTMIIAIKNAGILQTGKTPNGSIKTYFGQDYPFYNQTAFEQGLNICVASKHLSLRGIKAARLFRENSVLVCFIGAQFGKAGIVRNTGACNSQILSITPAENIVPEYLYYQIISSGFQAQMKQHANNFSISKAAFENLCIEVPPIKKQMEIINFLRDQQTYFDEKLLQLQSALIEIESKQLEVFSNLLSQGNLQANHIK